MDPGGGQGWHSCVSVRHRPFIFFSGRISFNLSLPLRVHFHQGRSQPNSPGWARVPLSSFFPQISINFSSNFTYFLPHFGPPGGQVAHPGRPWLRHWLGRACTHNGVKISHGKSLTMSNFCSPNYQNIELHISQGISKSLQIIANHQWFVPKFIEKNV